MQVISTEGRGRGTIYAVEQDGKQVRIKGSENLSPGAFEAWHRLQAREGYDGHQVCSNQGDLGSGSFTVVDILRGMHDGLD